MSYITSDSLANFALDGIADALQGGRLYLYAGPVPLAPYDPLNMGEHTELAVVSLAGEGGGLSFAAAADGLLEKAVLEVWKGEATFDGAESAEPALVPTFFRFCASGDNGRGGALTPRLQGTVGAPGSGADMERNPLALQAGAIVRIDTFSVGLGAFGG